MKMKMRKMTYNKTSKQDRLLSNDHQLLSQLGHLKAKIGPETAPAGGAAAATPRGVRS
jgi:hypothetical protein